MSLRLFNTLTRTLEEFTPLHPGRVLLYTCGPTVYDFAHIGNYRAYMFEDLLKRYLVASGFTVRHVMNLTDVDDKTIRASRAQGLPLDAYTRPFKDAFFADLQSLRIQRADVYPEATTHIGEMISLIQRLLERGYAYRSDDGSVYYNIAKFPGYGKLSHIDLSGLRPGARVAQDEYEKESVADFALWKAWDEADGEVAWDSPWGRGRPGWHVECSAMSMKHLGETFDIHCGGIDNMFPHHEDEIAQSEAATGKPFVRYWLHCAHLVVNGQKMSKTLRNFYTLRDVLDKGYSGREVRYVLLATHYRQSLNFTFEGLQGARAALARLDEFQERMAALAGPVPAGQGEAPSWAAEADSKFRENLDDDLNISGGLGGLFDMVHAGNKAADAGLASEGARGAMDVLTRLDQTLGFLAREEDQAGPEVAELVRRREEARKAKQWREADLLRTRLAELGWMVKDTPEGPKVRRVG